MEKWKHLFLIPVLVLASSAFVFPCLCSSSPVLGAHPLDTNYFSTDVIGCKDGSKSFTRDRLNDNFCDCLDGSDEPGPPPTTSFNLYLIASWNSHFVLLSAGTSACPAAKFYCRNAGSTPQFIYSSHVNDAFCDCCDGSDEYDSGIRCPNICIMGGTIRYSVESHKSTVSKQYKDEAEGKSIGVNLQDMIQKLEGLRMLAVLEVLVVCFMVVLWVHCRRPRLRRRQAYSSIIGCIILQLQAGCCGRSRFCFLSSEVAMFFIKLTES